MNKKSNNNFCLIYKKSKRNSKSSIRNKVSSYFSFEAILAITVLFSIILILTKSYSFNVTRVSEDKITKDIINLLSETKIRTLNIPFIIEKIKSGEISDIDSTILEVIGKEWINGNKNLSRFLAYEVTKNLLDDNMKFMITIKDNDTFIVIASSDDNISSNNYNYSDYNYSDSSSVLARRVISNKRMISGIEMEKPIEGITSRSILRSTENKTISKYFYFGGFVGQGNITSSLYLGDFKSIKKILFEGDISNEFQFMINGNLCEISSVPGGLYKIEIENNTITGYDFSECNNSLNKNSFNNFTFIFDLEDINSSFIGGGYLNVDYIVDSSVKEYNSGENNSEELITYFPGISGIINIFSGFFVPENFNSIEIYLDLLNYQDIFLNIGNITVFEKNSSNISSQILIDNEIFENYLNYDALRGKTIPLRLGTKNFTNIGETKRFGNGDTVLITDVSGSMAWRFDSSYYGTLRSCTDPNLNDLSTARISVAKCIDKDFIDRILFGIEGNNVALSSYSTSISDSQSLTTNITLLKSDVDSYVASGNTCISCGIFNAINLLSNVSFIIGSNESWNYLESYSDENPPLKSGLNWFDLNYDDSNWFTSTTPFGLDNISEVNYSYNTNLNETTKNYFFRKEFYLMNDTLYAPKIYVSSDDRAIVYVNGNMIINDTHDDYANYWNIDNNLAKILFFDGFESGTTSSWTLDSNTDGGVILINNDNYNGLYSLQMYGDGRGKNNIWFQKNFNLNDSLLPFLEFYLSLEDTESNDNFYVDVYDGSWHTVYKKYEDNGKDNYYISSRDDFKRIQIDLTSFNRENEIIIRFRTEIGSNSWYDSIQIDDISIKDYSLFNEGKNVVAVMIVNDDNESSFFDLQITEFDNLRKKAMLVMSDGEANRCYLAPDSSWDCGSSEASREAISAACIAKKNYNIDIYSVAFGIDADIYTMQNIAECDDINNFYVSTNITGLKEIYETIAEEMLLEMNIENTQNFDIVGNFNTSYLSPNSYIKITRNETIINDSYGKISATILSKIDPLNPIINIPQNAEIIDAKVTSYSKEYWTSKIIVNDNLVYNISMYGQNFTKIGDPYMIQIPLNYMSEENLIQIESRDISENTTYISNNNSIIYTILIDPSTSYSDVLDKNIGCRWLVEFDDLTNFTIDIPKNYIGNKTCSYTNSSISYDLSDTIDVSAYSLFKNLDLDDDGRVFIKFVENDLEIYLMSIPKVPYMWGPSIMEIRLWKDILIE